MTDSNKFKVGDKIVRFGEVCQITKIEKRKNDDGDAEEILYYKPYYAEPQTSKVTYSISVKNLSLASIRKPISKKELLDLIKVLSKTIEVDVPINIIEYKEAFNSNDPHEIAYTLKKIWIEKQEKADEISKSKNELYKASMKILVEEVALLKKTTVSKAEKIIKRALRK
jgi:RNA polymerase-interacting CarD/CdnL/TRCF family regulator